MERKPFHKYPISNLPYRQPQKGLNFLHWANPILDRQRLRKNKRKWHFQRIEAHIYRIQFELIFEYPYLSILITTFIQTFRINITFAILSFSPNFKRNEITTL